MKRSAFTFIELLITIVVLGIITISLAVSFDATKGKADFRNNQAEMINIFQKARALSLSNVVVDTTNEINTDYYLLDVAEGSITLTAYGSDSIYTTEIDSYTFDDEISLNKNFKVYYTPPYGDICIDDLTSCSTTSKAFTLIGKYGDIEYEQQYLISIHGGYAEEL